MSAAQHYTAVLEIQRTTVTTPTSASRYDKAEPPTREVVEVARVVIRSATLEDLREKIAAHAALVDDERPL